MLKSINQNLPLTEIDNLLDLFNQKAYSEVIKKTYLLIQKYPNNEQLFNIMGITLLTIEQYKKSIVFFKKSIRLNPNNAKSYFNIGVAHHELVNLKKALIYYKKAIELDHLYFDPLFNMGILNEEKGENTNKANSWKR